LIYADNGSDGKVAALDVADSGSVTVTSVTCTIAGSVSNLTFQNVTIGSPDGCRQSRVGYHVCELQGEPYSRHYCERLRRQHISVNFASAALRYRHD